MKLRLIDAQGRESGSLHASDALFGREFNEALVHQIVTAYLANGRSGSRAQKDRGEVKHSTRKPYPQKGTGRARAGMTSSPLWRGGGRIFPNRPDENFSQKVNRKMFRAGMAAILSQLVRDGRLQVIDGIHVEAPKTKLLVNKLKDMGIHERVLIITPQIDENLRLSARNLASVMVLKPHQADPVSLIRFDRVLLTPDAVKSFEEMYV